MMGVYRLMVTVVPTSRHSALLQQEKTTLFLPIIRNTSTTILGHFSHDNIMKLTIPLHPYQVEKRVFIDPGGIFGDICCCSRTQPRNHFIQSQTPEEFGHQWSLRKKLNLTLPIYTTQSLFNGQVAMAAVVMIFWGKPTWDRKNKQTTRHYFSTSKF